MVEEKDEGKKNEETPEAQPSPSMPSKGEKLGDNPAYQRRHDQHDHNEAQRVREEEEQKALKRLPETGARASVEELEKAKQMGAEDGDRVVKERGLEPEEPAKPASKSKTTDKK